VSKHKKHCEKTQNFCAKAFKYILFHHHVRINVSGAANHHIRPHLHCMLQVTQIRFFPLIMAQIGSDMMDMREDSMMESCLQCVMKSKAYAQYWL